MAMVRLWQCRFGFLRHLCFLLVAALLSVPRLCLGSEFEYVTCGSVVKLLNTRHNVRLHSHDVKYGSAVSWVLKAFLMFHSDIFSTSPVYLSWISVHIFSTSPVYLSWISVLLHGTIHWLSTWEYVGRGARLSGSGQQSVTGVEAPDDANSYWKIRGKVDNGCVRGAPVKCGQSVRLTHVNTGRNLHSHHFVSPLSGNQFSTLKLGFNWKLRSQLIIHRKRVMAVSWFVFGIQLWFAALGDWFVLFFTAATDASVLGWDALFRPDSQRYMIITRGLFSGSCFGDEGGFPNIVDSTSLLQPGSNSQPFCQYGNSLVNQQVGGGDSFLPPAAGNSEAFKDHLSAYAVPSLGR
ncbi:uncharacterized protein LOC122800342 [Protopterus annectens]|uniref:uncharacterized protein LOC122800342 n=1 Tax=Protopterus annectens TaxID=7888 RepID=UPI001CFB874D|nr:uncharacterized protein LOC122800342 [Protopterus annectens]